MPINIALTDDKLVAFVKLIKPGKKTEKTEASIADEISFEAIYDYLKAQNFLFTRSGELIKQEVERFKESNEKISRLRIYTDKLLELATFFKVQITGDEMKAYVDVDIPKAEEYNETLKLPALMRILKNAGITACLLTSNLNKLVNTFNKQKGKKVTKYQVANGIPELQAEDGQVELHVPFDSKTILLHQIKKGGVKHQQTLPALYTSQTYPIGTKLLTRYLAQKGREGLTITNKKLWSDSNKKSVSSAVVIVSKNVEARTSPEKIEYFSQVQGIAYFINEKIIEVEEAFDGNFNLTASQDKMQLLLSLKASHKGKDIDEEAIYQKIASLDLKVKIDKTAIHEAVSKVNQNNPSLIEGICIAKGFEPENGLDGRLLWNVNLDVFYRPKILEDGSVDYKGGNRFPFVRAGQTAGKWIPMTKGETPGHDIFGKPIPSQDGKEVELSFNDMFDLEETHQDNRKAKFLKAKLSGLLITKQKKIVIDPVFEIKNIDNSTGHIDFDGTVIVQGTVADGFVVKSTKDIHIHEGVGACFLEAGGDIYIKGGVNGRNQGNIKARGNIFIQYAENCTVEARGNLYIATHAIRSTCIAYHGEIRVGLNRKKGRIIGGIYYAWQLIQTSLVGSERAAQNAQLWAGINKETWDEYEALAQKIEQAQKDISTTERKRLSLLPHTKKTTIAAKQPQTTALLTDTTTSDEKILEGLEQGIMLKKEELNQLITRQQDLQNSMYNPDDIFVEVTDKAEEQTVILIRDKSLKLVSPAEKIRFRLNNAVIIKEKLKK